MNTCDLVLHYHTEEGSEKYTIERECRFIGCEADKVHILAEVFEALKIYCCGHEEYLCKTALELMQRQKGAQP